MNQTEPDARRLAGELFDEVILPLADLRRKAGISSLTSVWDADATTYFSAPYMRVMKGNDFEAHGGGTPEGLMTALLAYWHEQGEPDLARMSARMQSVADALRAESLQRDGKVDVLCYTLF